MRVFQVAAAVALCAAATACDARPEADDGATSWTLGDAPDVTIGATEGDSVYLFQRIQSAHFASGGRIVVADAGLKVIRVFDASGRFVRQFGRAGDGPGEFTALRGAWMASADTVGVWDSRAMRLSYFTLDGDLLETAQVRPPAGSTASLDFLAGALSDGSVVIGAISVTPHQDPHGRPDEVHLTHYDRSGAYLGTVAVMDGLVRAPFGRTFGPIPFSPFPYTAVLNDSVAFTDGARPTVSVRDLDGQGREVTFPSEAVASDSAWAALRSALEARNDWQLQMLADAPHSDSLPHIAGLLVDDEGDVWTKRFDPRTDALWLRSGQVQGGTWLVSTDEGIRQVVLPEAFRPVQVANRRVLGVSTDSLGVERVAVYPLLGSGEGR